MRRAISARWRFVRADGLGLGQQVFVLYALIVVLVIGAGVVAAILIGDRLIRRGAEEQVESVAWTVAGMAEVAAGLESEDPTGALQPLTDELRQTADVLYVVVTDPDGLRHTHPDPSVIGEPLIGTIEPARQGEAVVEVAEGHLDRSVRAVVPVTSDDGDLLGLVAVGVTVDRKREALDDAFPLLFGVAAFSLVVAALGSWWIAHRVARQTFGLGEAELARVYTHHDAALHAIREGLVVVDVNRRVTLINDAAQELLGVGPEVEGEPVQTLPVAGPLAEVLAAGTRVEDEVHLAGERLVVVSQVPVCTEANGPGGAGIGTVLTMRDHSEVMALADELSTTRSLADGLRAQVHESANRLHTIVMLVELGDTDAAVELATGEMRAKKLLTNRLVSQFEEPTLVALLLGKMAEAERRSVDLAITEDSRLRREWSEPVDLVTIVGNLVDNAMDAALAGPGPARVEVAVREDDALLIRVRDSGPGFSPEALLHAFEPGWSTKPAGPDRRQGRGLGMALVQQVVNRRGGVVHAANPGPDDHHRLRGAVVTVRLHLPEKTAGSG